MNSYWEKLRRLAMQLFPTGYAGRYGCLFNMTKRSDTYSRNSGSGFIEGYRFIPGDACNRSRQYEILPDGYFDLAFLLSETTCKVFLAGPYTQKTYVPLGTYELFIVHFKSGRVPKLTDSSPCELINTMFELPGVFGLCADALGEELARYRAPEERKHFIDKLFCRSEIPWALTDTIYESATSLIDASGGQIQISELARILGVNTRILERRFRQNLGFSPKMFARLVRFQKIVEKLRDFPGSSRLTDIAHEFGYTDQSHFIRDFKSLSGVLPGSL